MCQIFPNSLTNVQRHRRAPEGMEEQQRGVLQDPEARKASAAAWRRSGGGEWLGGRLAERLGSGFRTRRQVLPEAQFTCASNVPAPTAARARCLPACLTLGSLAPAHEPPFRRAGGTQRHYVASVSPTGKAGRSFLHCPCCGAFRHKGAAVLTSDGDHRHVPCGPKSHVCHAPH